MFQLHMGQATGLFLCQPRRGRAAHTSSLERMPVLTEHVSSRSHQIAGTLAHAISVPFVCLATRRSNSGTPTASASRAIASNVHDQCTRHVLYTAMLVQQCARITMLEVRACRHFVIMVCTAGALPLLQTKTRLHWQLTSVIL
jgi:hypothetical protein